jgi:hypothetical protein
VDLAVARGFPMDSADLVLHTWARFGGDPESQRHPNDPEHWMEVQVDVEHWLNDHIAPPGYHFGWHDGDFVMVSDAIWCEWSGPGCTDAGHNHGAPLEPCGCPSAIVTDEGHQSGCALARTI